MTVEDLLRGQHREMEELVRRARALGSSSGRLRARDELAKLLRAHSSLEEEELYPKLEGIDETADWADASFRAHELIKEVLLELDGCAPDEAEYLGILDELEELLDEHFGFEEKRVLPWLVAEWPEEQREALGAEMAARFDELRTSGTRPVVELDPDQLPEA